MGKKTRTSITIREETRSRILQYAEENHLNGGLSGALEYIAWHVLQVKEDNSLENWDEQKLENTISV